MLPVADVTRRNVPSGCASHSSMSSSSSASSTRSQRRPPGALDERFEAFGGWLEQLIAESTGKHGVGILPVLGTNNVERSAKISDALKVSLDRQDWYTLYEAGLGTEVP